MSRAAIEPLPVSSSTRPMMPPMNQMKKPWKDRPTATVDEIAQSTAVAHCLSCRILIEAWFVVVACPQPEALHKHKIVIIITFFFCGFDRVSRAAPAGLPILPPSLLPSPFPEDLSEEEEGSANRKLLDVGEVSGEESDDDLEGKRAVG